MMRTLILPNGDAWKYRVGKSAVRLTHPDGHSFAVDLSELTGRLWTDIERGRWKGTIDGMIGPGDVRKYIETAGLEID